MVPVRPRRFVRTLAALLAFASLLPAQELSPEEASSLLAKLAASRRGAGMQADFREERRIPLMKEKIVETGILSFLPPNCFRREVDGGSLTVCDGQTLWLYYPQFKEVEKYSLSSNSTLRDSVTAMTAGFGLQQLSESFKVRAWKTEGGTRVELVPRNPSLRKSVSSIQADISGELKARRLEIVGKGGERTTTTFSNERRANLTAAADFQFRPPDGVSVSEPLKQAPR